MIRYFVQLSYKGTEFHGWQIQPNASTIQETLQKAFSLVLGENISIIGCGRTDTGVHARYFIAHFDCKVPIIDSGKLCFKLNSLLPKSIAIQRIFPVANEAHARFDASERTYKYYISKEKNPFRQEESCYIPYSLDIKKMNKAALLLLEYNDFTSFSKLHTDVKTNICHLKEAHWESENKELIFTITADRFLRNMVRAIVGTLLMVGKGKCSLSEFREIIEAKDRGKAGSSAAAKGLFLHHIAYPYITI